MRKPHSGGDPGRPVVRVGCSGFMYDHWKGTFYPNDLPKSRWFEYYRRHFESVEMNVTFYRLPKPETIAKWYRESAAGYSFALKGSRFITHIRRLRDIEEPLVRFFDMALGLREKLAVVLWQFPPSFSFDPGRLANFLRLLGRYKVRQAFEFRDESWMAPEALDALRTGGHSVCHADWPPFNREPPITTDFVYIRRHGREGRYDSRYTDAELRRDARKMRSWRKRGLDVFIYFNNDAFGYAPANALELKGLLRR